MEANYNGVTRVLETKKGLLWKLSFSPEHTELFDLSWYPHPEGYAQTQIGGTTVLAHWLAAGLAFGGNSEPIGGYAIHKRPDHKDSNGFNNCVSNLRPATCSQNSANTSRRPGKSGYRGVFRRPNGQFSAYIGSGKTRKHLGSFDAADLAARAYDAAALARWGDFARPNFPQDVAA